MRIPDNPPKMSLFKSLDRARLEAIMGARLGATHNGRYLHWDKLQHLPPPEGFDHREWWWGLKFARWMSQKRTPLLATDGQSFVFGMPDPIPEHLHHIDQDAAGQIQMSDQSITNPATRDRYIVHSLIEEAITSSQLEGASTTRRVAKEMIRTRRPPRDRSEKMILNNYHAMRRIRQFRGQPLTEKLLLELHLILAEGTLDESDAAGRFRGPDELVRVYDLENQILHDPPPAEALPDQIKALLDFANGKIPDHFIHPVIRAILLHFWLAYLHPFVDGNGRCARALFYWSMLNHGYWLFEFLSISQIIRKAPVQYGRAFLYTETDENDLTYFIFYHINVIRQAIDSLHQYIAQKVGQVREAENIMRVSARFNSRQLALLSHALRHADAEYTIGSHQQSHNIVHQTARMDLYDLADRGLLVKRKIGRTFCFRPAENLEERLGETL